MHIECGEGCRKGANDNITKALRTNRLLIANCLPNNGGQIIKRTTVQLACEDTIKSAAHLSSVGTPFSSNLTCCTNVWYDTSHSNSVTGPHTLPLWL